MFNFISAWDRQKYSNVKIFSTYSTLLYALHTLALMQKILLQNFLIYIAHFIVWSVPQEGQIGLPLYSWVWFMGGANEYMPSNVHITQASNPIAEVLILCVSFCFTALCCVPLRFNEGLYRRKGSVTCTLDLVLGTQKQFCLSLMDTYSETVAFAMK